MTVLPHHVYSQYLKYVQLQKSKIALRSYSGQPLHVVGDQFRASYMAVPVQYGDQHTMRRMLVVHAPSKPPLLGRNWLQSIKLDWQSLFMVQDNPPDVISELKVVSYSNQTWEHYADTKRIPRYRRVQGVPSLAVTRLQRWALILSLYNYQLEYVPEVTNAEAVMLS